MRRSWFIMILSIALVASPAAGSSGGVADQAGDANGANGAWYSAAMLGWIAEYVRDTTTGGDPAGGGVAGPVSYGPADLREVSFATEHEAVAVGDDGVDYRPEALLVRITTEEPARAPTEHRPMDIEVVAQVRAPGAPPLPPDDPTTLTIGQSECRMSFTVTVDDLGRAGASWFRFENCGASSQGGTDPAWTAAVDGTTITLRYPLASFDGVSRQYLAEGGRVRRWSAGSKATMTTLDVTVEGPDFVIGSDMPPDVPCTVGCPEAS